MSDFQVYTLQPKQIEFSESKAKFRLYGGAKGGGKSYAMRSECLKQCLAAPNIRGLALRRTFPEIEQNMLVPMSSELPKEVYTPNIGKAFFKFNNGSTLKFSHCRNFQDVMRYAGIEYDFICIEELTHWMEREFKILMNCLRTSREGIMPNGFFSTNPGGVGHAWVRRLFVDRKFQHGEKPENYDFISAKVYDNAALMKAQPEYEEDLQNLPDALRRAYLDGDWDVFEGQYFTEFNRDKHVIEPVVRKDFIKKRIIVFDYGYTAPSCVLWMDQDTQDNVCVYRELYITGCTYRQLAIRIKALTPKEEMEEISIILSDPAIVQKKSETTGSSAKDEMAKVGIHIKPANNSRISGWNVVRKYLKVARDPNSRELNSKLKITSNCSNLIRTLPEQLHDDKNPEDLNTKLEDHAADTLRYGLMELGIAKETLSSVSSINQRLTKGNNSDVQQSKSSLFKKPSRSRSTSDHQIF